MGEQFCGLRCTAVRAAALAALGLACLLLCLSGCGRRLVPSPGPPPWSSVAGTLQISGPLPVYYAYDGAQPLASDVLIGLFRSGSATLEMYSDIAPPSGMNPDNNLNAICSFDISFITEAVPLGSYDLAVFGAAPGDAFTGSLFGPFTPVVLQRARQITLTTPGQQEHGIALSANFTGPAPYGSISGALLVSGNPLSVQLPSIVLKPATPAPGVDPATGLLWRLDETLLRHGRLPFTVPALSYGTYAVSYAGASLRDRDDPYAVSSQDVTLSAAAPDASGLAIKVANSGQGQRPYELGLIRGEVILPETPSPDAVYCIEARRSDLPQDDPAWQYGQYLVAQWVTLGYEFTPPIGPAQVILSPDSTIGFFLLAWLEEGEYTISIYRLSDTPEGEDALLLQTAEPVAITAAQHEVWGLQLEVLP